MKPVTKKNTQMPNGHGNGRHAVQVEFSDPVATSVGIAGTFNDWRAEATPMVNMGQGRWLKELVLPSGTYEYLFVVDGRWVPDPLAQATRPNPFGGVNSVINVQSGSPPRARAKSDLWL